MKGKCNLELTSLPLDLVDKRSLAGEFAVYDLIFICLPFDVDAAIAKPKFDADVAMLSLLLWSVGFSQLCFSLPSRRSCVYFFGGRLLNRTWRLAELQAD